MQYNLVNTCICSVPFARSSKLSCVSWSSAVSSQLGVSDYEGCVTIWDTTTGQQVRSNQRTAYVPVNMPSGLPIFHLLLQYCQNCCPVLKYYGQKDTYGQKGR